MYGYWTWKVASLGETSKRQSEFLMEIIIRLSGCNLLKHFRHQRTFVVDWRQMRRVKWPSPNHHVVHVLCIPMRNRTQFRHKTVRAIR